MENLLKENQPSKGKIIGKSHFKYVCRWRHENHGRGYIIESWRCFVPKSVTGVSHLSFHEKESDAAKAADKYLASHGFMPVNCLKKL